MPNIDMLTKKAMEEILHGEVFELDMDEVSQLAGETPKTIWCNGCFDVIHAGHIELLKYARSLGQRLVVGIDTDARVKQSKGESRPINNLELRKKVLESIRYVDQVVSFSTNEELIGEIRKSGADTIVVGAEYKGRVIGADAVKTTIFFPRSYNLSTTQIIEGGGVYTDLMRK